MCVQMKRLKTWTCLFRPKLSCKKSSHLMKQVAPGSDVHWFLCKNSDGRRRMDGECQVGEGHSDRAGCCTTPASSCKLGQKDLPHPYITLQIRVAASAIHWFRLELSCRPSCGLTGGFLQVSSLTSYYWNAVQSNADILAPCCRRLQCLSAAVKK